MEHSLIVIIFCGGLPLELEVLLRLVGRSSRVLGFHTM